MPGNQQFGGEAGGPFDGSIETIPRFQYNYIWSDSERQVQLRTKGGDNRSVGPISNVLSNDRYEDGSQIGGSSPKLDAKALRLF